MPKGLSLCVILWIYENKGYIFYIACPFFDIDPFNEEAGPALEDT